MNHLGLPCKFTVIERREKGIVENAISGTKVRVLGETTLTGSPHQTLAMLPQTVNTLCIDHETGNVYGRTANSLATECLGDLFQYLDYPRLVPAYVNAKKKFIHFQAGRIDEAAMCISQVTDIPLARCIVDLHYGRPLYLRKSQVSEILIAALRIVARNATLRESIRPENDEFGVNDIFLAITPLENKDSAKTLEKTRLEETVGDRS